MSLNVPAQGLAVTTWKNISDKSLKLEADAVIVGSGAGGAVMAYELAKAGKKVIILEGGSYVPSADFTERFPEMLEKLYADRGNQTNASGDLMVLQGTCVGGSTVVNGCVAFRTPDFILHEWAEKYGLDNLTPEKLAPYFDKTEKNLSVHVNGEHEINTNSRIMREGAEKLNISCKPLQRNIKTCGLTGHCLSGCKTDRKQSMLVTYLPWAIAHGATLYANTMVTQIVTADGKARGVVAEVISPETGSKVADVSVTAKIVVVSAGAVQTPILFQRSKLGNSSGQVGKNFACHPSTLMLGEFDKEIYPWRGAMLGVYVDEYEHPDKGGFILEGGNAGPVEIGMAVEPGTGSVYVDFMSRSKNYASMVTLIHDHNVGEVKWEDGKKVIHYDLSEEDFPAMKAAFKAAAKIYFAAGAKRVFIPTTNRLVIENENEIEKIVESIPYGPQTIRMVSYHPQGTMRMGKDKTSSVVNPYGEAHDVGNLFVADASLFPTSIIVNPQMTVYAISTYIAEQILKNDAKYFA